VSKRDVASLNEIQFVSADKNVYFHNWDMKLDLVETRNRVQGLRIDDPNVVAEYGHDTDETRSLLVGYEQSPQLGLDLEFLKIRPRANRVPMDERPRQVRRVAVDSGDYSVPPRPEGPATFSRFLGRR
jgi:hypothetical protein